jgi:membrane associated rhomboid family serine protease
MLFWLVLNVYFGLTSFGIGGSEGGVAWEAHIGGFVCGLLIFGFFDKRRPSDDPVRVS